MQSPLLQQQHGLGGAALPRAAGPRRVAVASSDVGSRMAQRRQQQQGRPLGERRCRCRLFAASECCRLPATFLLHSLAATLPPLLPVHNLIAHLYLQAS